MESLPSFVSKCALEGDESRPKHDHAEFLCIDCWDSLCLSCSTAHKLTKLTKNHTVKKLNDINQEDVDRHKVKLMSLCAKHDQEYVLYCNHCEELACTICFATSHSSYPCKCIELKAADTQFISLIKKEVDNIDRELNDVSKHINKVDVPLKAMERHRTHIVSQYAELKQKIRDACNSIIDDLESTEKHFLINLDKESTKLKNYCKQDEERIAALRASSEPAKLCLLSSSSIYDRFIYLKQKKQKDSPAVSFIHASHLTIKNIDQTVLNTENLDKLSRCKVELQKIRKLQLVGSIQDSRLRTEIIFFLSLYDNCLFIGRQDSTKLSVYNLKNLKYLRYQRLRDGVQPTDVKVLNNGNIACLSNRSRRVVLMTQNCNLISETSMMDPMFCFINKSDNIIYIASSHAGIYKSIDGINFSHIFSSPDNAHCYGVVAIPSNPNVGEIYWVCECKDDVYYRMREYIIKWSEEGIMSMTYTEINIEYFDNTKEATICIEANYMAYDGGDYIYVSDGTNNTVHAFDIKNKTPRLLLTTENQLNKPSSLAVDEKCCRLYVGQSNGQVLIFGLDDIKKIYNFKVVL